jgi:serine/threonine-protein phosphatase 5
MKYNECNKIVKQIAFEKAISVDQKEVNIADSINLDSMSKYLNITSMIQTI